MKHNFEVGDEEFKIGDVGYFWFDSENYCIYGRLKELRPNNTHKYANTNGGVYQRFSFTLPELNY